MSSTTTSSTQTEQIYLSPELQENIQNRLSRIEGHVRGVKRMLDEHQDCESILIQLAAIKSALNQVIIKVLEGHMETCVMECVVEGQGEEALERLRGAVSLVLKKS
ncbi:metal-sensitive transcriptional regulator [Candidatus Parcubacteria bacterium]|nr:MAG: metal-sensitive transcriptional regulator [Candidatus Parcubacteria bacterium]